MMTNLISTGAIVRKIIISAIAITFSFSAYCAELKIFTDKDGNTLLTNTVGEDGKPHGSIEDGGDLSKYDKLKKTITYTDAKEEKTITYTDANATKVEKKFDPKKPCVNRAEWEIMGGIEQINAKYDFYRCLIDKAASKRGITDKREIYEYKMMIWDMNHR